MLTDVDGTKLVEAVEVVGFGSEVSERILADVAAVLGVVVVNVEVAEEDDFGSGVSERTLADVNSIEVVEVRVVEDRVVEVEVVEDDFACEVSERRLVSVIVMYNDEQDPVVVGFPIVVAEVPPLIVEYIMTVTLNTEVHVVLVFLVVVVTGVVKPRIAVLPVVAYVAGEEVACRENRTL